MVPKSQESERFRPFVGRFTNGPRNGITPGPSALRLRSATGGGARRTGAAHERPGGSARKRNPRR